MSADLKNRIKGRPELLRAAETANGTVYLAWKEALGAQKYIVERFDRETQRYRRLIALPADVLEYTDEDVHPGGVYRYRIKAKRKNPGGEVLRRRGMAVSVSIVSDETVKLMQAEHPTFGVAKLTWEPNEHADGYRINRRPIEIDKPMPLTFVGKRAATYTDRTCVSGQIYFYSIQSYCNSDDDEMVFSRVGNEMMIVNLDKPEILSVKKKHGRTTRFDLRITAGAQCYVLFRADSKNGPYTEVCRSKNITDLTLEDKGGRNPKGSYYIIKCMRAYGGKEYFGEPTDPVFVK